MIALNYLPQTSLSSRNSWHREYSTTPPPSSRFAPYRQALNALAERTRTPLPSLVFSFAILHEITAIVPLIGFFYGARTLKAGDRLIASLPERIDDSELIAPGEGWMAAKGREWWREGTSWAERVGRRYGIFGFEKRDHGEQVGGPVKSAVAGGVSADVANAVVAYCLTKASMPARVGVSLYLSPAFSRQVVEPVRRAVIRVFQRQSK
ncbi:hypothetical protein POSPLADRAFT_1145256 [Postia placenta MAD-698-R-SB12]|uniref:Uncharacterized protein n=1 Tax=Postia placenta MAD-698-R-SB12 TaxID=670580 RepID=A0A1X6MZS5_9APHY|nr:hypothetical protein POSPLADRAFT_1145256 [Postia placenta MAD-698-R-SB12]OSX61693.1 hypothetical protein POSPLADRAFT_1145256 [Postia placenta MAD-698-R-SB12]